MQIQMTANQKITIPKHCVFCDKTAPAIQISKEHIFRHALRKLFPSTTQNYRFEKKTRNLQTLEISHRRHTFKSGGFDMTINKVCRTCNGGWLNNKVEIACEKILNKLIIGQPHEFNDDTAAAIALWATKTAMVRALADDGINFISNEKYHYLAKHLKPPENFIVWLANTEFHLSP